MSKTAEKFILYLDGIHGLMYGYKVELLQLGARASLYKSIALRYDTKEIEFGLDTIDGEMLLTMEGHLEVEGDKIAGMIRLFKMCAEMQYYEDKWNKPVAPELDESAFTIRRIKGKAYFRVDMPLSMDLSVTIGTTTILTDFIDVISQEG